MALIALDFTPLYRTGFNLEFVTLFEHSHKSEYGLSQCYK